MANISEIALDKNFNSDEWTVPPLPKEKDTRGFIYVVQDKQYPKLLKIGRTQDFVKRAKQYNNDRPFEDVIPIICTKLIDNCEQLERMLLNELLRSFSSVGKSQEWFPDDAMEDILQFIKEMDIDYVRFNELWRDVPW